MRARFRSSIQTNNGDAANGSAGGGFDQTLLRTIVSADIESAEALVEHYLLELGALHCPESGCMATFAYEDCTCMLSTS